jgi:Flp pilus assembly protein TadG
MARWSLLPAGGAIRRPQDKCRALLRDRSGSPAMEFALIAPVMFILLTGSYDISQLMIARQQVVSTAQQIVEIATELSIQPDQTTSLTVNQAYQAETAIYALMPRLKSGVDTNKFSVTLVRPEGARSPRGCKSHPGNGRLAR